MYRIYKLSHYLGTRLVKTVVILARYSVYTNQYDFMEKIVTIENFIFLRLKSHFCDENHFRRKSHFCDESHFRPFYPFLRRKSQTVSTKVFATKVLAPICSFYPYLPFVTRLLYSKLDFHMLLRPYTETPHLNHVKLSIDGTLKSL